VTPRNRQDDNQEEAGDYWRDSWQRGKTALGVGRVGSQNHILREEEPFWKLQIISPSAYPQGVRERGRGDNDRSMQVQKNLQKQPWPKDPPSQD